MSSSRSSKTHDIYSLGVVLIEIALWAPIEKVLEQCFGKKVTRSKTPWIREGLLTYPYNGFENVTEAVAALAGDSYAAATRRCIEGGPALGLDRPSRGVPEKGGASGGGGGSGKLQEVFYEEVYRKIGAVEV